jgi:hypothetical protein
MKHRGQQVSLENIVTKEVVRVVVVLADSKQGYLAADTNVISPLVQHFIDEKDWQWYHPDSWKEVPHG